MKDSEEEKGQFWGILICTILKRSSPVKEKCIFKKERDQYSFLWFLMALPRFRLTCREK